MKGPVRVWIALGANVGDRAASLEGALAALTETRGLEVLRRSRWFETEPIGGPPGQASYLNGVAELACSLAPQELLHALQAIEARFGRDRRGEVRHGPRTLDLDVLFFGEEEVADPDLVIPHPRLEERIFVLQPLASLVPDKRLPRCGRTVRERLAELSVPSSMTR